MAKKVGASEGLFSDLNFTDISETRNETDPPISYMQRNNSVGRPKNPEATVKKSFYLTTQVYEALLLYRDCNSEGAKDFSKIANEAFKQFFVKELRILKEVEHISDASRRHKVALQKLLAENLEE